MSSTSPGINERVEITVKRGGTYRSRVEDLDGPLLSLAAPLDLLVTDVPDPGMELTVRWIAGERGRYAADAVIIRIVHGHVSTWVVEITGRPMIEQNREYVRGGGGEPVELTGEDGEPHRGEVIDVSERSIKAVFKRLEIAEGSEVALRVLLESEQMTLHGTVYRVVDQAATSEVQVVLMLDADESQAQAIRRHVMNLQRLARARARDHA
ncbi:hypothetical protein J2S43_007812 [Catenuloplanes nepalensis]|uniref:PilZ domain-containing protein n=1 Tax=Catenuloplanes nepalensis TaxID=587533 RepID=A0ABT9N6G6_9ACTN|nr:flagellar brake domain-containing protein [Catenuloplanes nepalensis]MDP9799300.1 hypothetical protein [Catenuloplanes nepalensis]